MGGAEKIIVNSEFAHAKVCCPTSMSSIRDGLAFEKVFDLCF